MKHAVHKTKGGLIRISLNADKVIRYIRITGDFFFCPEEAVELLEKELIGVGASEEDVLKFIKNFYEDKGIEAPGLKPEDFAEAIKKAL